MCVPQCVHVVTVNLIIDHCFITLRICKITKVSSVLLAHVIIIVHYCSVVIVIIMVYFQK